MNGRAETARQYVDDLAGSGRYFFSSADAQEALGVSPAAAKMALHRLSQQGLVASPARGYYAIVPPEYRALGCPPAEQWIPSLMERLGMHYYAGLLTAAQYHGAAHQRPQEFQVCLERARRPLVCSRVRVAFIVRKRLPDVPVQRINTPRCQGRWSESRNHRFKMSPVLRRSCPLTVRTRRCGNVGISRSARDFQAPVEIVL